MKYEVQPAPTDGEKRRVLNEKVLYLIDSGLAQSAGITNADMFNAYTGDGGLHGLERGDYENYHEYSEAKKEIENGQFFTPPNLCRLVCEALAFSSADMVADLTCGKGSFFNFLPAESNIYGCEIDPKAYKVAHYLYPQANLTLGDVRGYKPDIRFDYILGNPPFHLHWQTEDGEYLSQFYYCIKAAELLKPLGIMALVVPQSFLADDFLDKKMIRALEAKFSFLGQVGLPEGAFSDLGVTRFPTKLQFWQKRGDAPGWEPHRYTLDLLYSIASLNTSDAVAWEAKKLYENVLSLPKADLEKNKSYIMLQLAREHEVSKEFTYQTQKLLYQIKAHPATREKYAKCCEYLHRFYTQKKPAGMTEKEWSRSKLTEKKVLVYLRKALSQQVRKPEQDVIRLVKHDDRLAYKAYSRKTKLDMPNYMNTPTQIFDAVLDDDPEQYPGFERFLRRKRREYDNQSQRFSEMKESEKIAGFLRDLTIWDAENEEPIRLNEIQRHDVNLVLQKRYGMLQWEQGSGKTLAGIAVATYRMLYQNVHSAWVISTAISIRNNWNVVLESYGIPTVLVDKLSDLDMIQPGSFVLLTFKKLRLFQKQVKKWIKMRHQNIQLVLDESDEISNPDTVRAKAALSCFRRCRFKLLTTGTSTRNNISEFAPQLELMYNNSINMLSWCHEVFTYEKSKEEDAQVLTSDSNEYYGCPIPAYKAGYRLFTKSHLPEKTTVFGIGERTQDIYNSGVLNDILAKTVITRTFEEVSGKDIRRLHQVPLRFSDEELDAYDIVCREFERIERGYFGSTGNDRKDAMLRLILRFCQK